MNFVLFFKQVAHFGGIQDALVRAETDIFQAFYGKEPRDVELYQRHLELEGRAVVVDWYDLPQDWFATAEQKLRKEGKIFFYTREDLPKRLQQFRDAGYQVHLWKRYDFLEAKPIFFKCCRRIASAISGKVIKKVSSSGSKRPELWVYLIQQGPPEGDVR